MQIKINDIKNKAIPLLKESGVVRSSLFGSFVRGEETDNSDIDFLVELPKDKSYLDLVRLELKLEKALDKKVDLLTYQSISPYLKDYIQKDQLAIL